MACVLWMPAIGAIRPITVDRKKYEKPKDPGESIGHGKQEGQHAQTEPSVIPPGYGPGSQPHYDGGDRGDTPGIQAEK